MALFWYTLSTTPTCPFFPTLLLDLCCKHSHCLYHCLTDWQREPLSTQHISTSSQRVKCRYGRPLSTWNTETFTMKSFTTGQYWGMSANILRTVGSQEASIKHGDTRIKSLNWPVTCSARNLVRTKGPNAGGGNT